MYFEKYVKGKHAASLWVRNIQLGMYGVPLRWVGQLLRACQRGSGGGGGGAGMHGVPLRYATTHAWVGHIAAGVVGSPARR